MLPSKKKLSFVNAVVVELDVLNQRMAAITGRE